MVSLVRQKDYRGPQKLAFCYLCGEVFAPGDKTNRDHIPAQCIFLDEDREPLWLPTHVTCNTGESAVDEKMGQLIALKYGKVPSSPEKQRLEFTSFSDARAAVTNLSIDQAVWRWVRGCHAALYGESIAIDGVAAAGALVTPFPRATASPAGPVIEPLREQHGRIVHTIKLNRFKGNLDLVHTNRGKFRYECVWVQADSGEWMCMFAIDLYDWKDLGRTDGVPARGCAGFYRFASDRIPDLATRGQELSIIIPDYDTLDPFAM